MNHVLTRSIPDTKFMIPSRPADFISRERISALLTPLDDYRLTLLCSSAGSGKSTALGDYFKDRDASPLWISLEEADDDLGRFWFCLVLAFGKILPHMEDLADSAISFSGDIDVFLAGLINRIGREPDRFILVLDDFQRIGDPSILRSLAFFIEHLPQNLHILLTSRHLPSLPLSRWRGKGWIREITEEDLSFSREESVAFLKDTGAEGDLIESVFDKTEGWIVGLRLARIALDKGARDLGRILHGANGRDRYLEDYLCSEIFSPLDEEARLFLTSTSPVDTLSVELCDYLTDRNDSESFMEKMEDIRFLIVPLGEKAFRYHHLLRDFLLKQLKDESPRYYRELHIKAARWYADRNDLSRALSHLLKGEEYEETAEFLLDNCGRFAYRGEMGQLLRLLEKLPMNTVRSRPRLMQSYVWSLVNSYCLEEAEKWLCLLSQYEDDSAEGRSMSGCIAAVRSRLASLSDDAPRSLALTEEALELISDEFYRADLEFNLAGSYRLAFDYERAVSTYLKASDTAWELQNARVGAYSLFFCSWLYQDMGRMSDARQVLDEGDKLWRRKGNVTCWLDLGRGFLEYEEGHLSLSLECLQRAVRKARLLGDLKPEVYGECGLALLYHALGDDGRSDETADRIISLIEDCELDRIADFAGVRIAHLRFLQGRSLDLSRWIAINPVDDKHPEYLEWHGMVHLERESAFSGGDRLFFDKLRRDRLEAFQAQKLLRELARDEMIMAVARAGEGDPSLISEALEAAQEARSVACAAEQLARIPHVERRGYLSPLRKDFSDRIREWLKSAPLPDEGEASISDELYEQLSPREREILELIGQGESNREIGGTLFISQDTVKWHVKNILAKLSVKNRTAAVARARELGFL